MNYYIYKTTNLQNGKYYIGAHHGELNDDYLGSGSALHRAIKKYGREVFVKEVLCICTNQAAMYFMEKIYVNEQEVASKQCYNMKPGGYGGGNGGATKGKSINHGGNGGKNKGMKYRDTSKMSIARLGNKNAKGLAGKLWWNNGSENFRCATSPGPEWKRGRIRGWKWRTSQTEI